MVERTSLPLDQEIEFRAWAKRNGITDVDAEQSRYDYRGYWLDVASKGGDQTKAYADGPHFPDTFKQHGHPSFSVESKYSEGPHDGGRWVGEDYVPNGADALGTSRRDVDPEFLKKAVIALAKYMPQRLPQ